MKIAIIGGGWVGCHLAYKLRQKHDVKIFEKNSKLFTETSYKNQNRLHLGYHYARSYETRELCRTTFDRFLNDYEFATKKIDKNFYCVSKNNSLIDYKTYIKIFEDFNYDEVTHNLDLIEGCINTDERYINFEKMFDFFNEHLDYEQRSITEKEIRKLQKKYDLVINATNNQILDKSIDNFFYELTISFLYKKISETDFDSLTLVDGDLFSIYPYSDEIYTVTDVKYTPIKKFKKIKNLQTYIKQQVTDDLINEKKRLIEQKIKTYYPRFLETFECYSYFLSTKSKLAVQSDSRYPVITKCDNLVNCFTGKIQGIYLIEDYIKGITDGTNTTY
jgi:hypothetical protein